MEHWKDFRTAGKYYDPDGNEMTLDDWVKSFEDPTLKLVAQTKIGPFFISTVWLGCDHAWFGGPPLIFETMVFSEEDKTLDMDRYTSKREAWEGHKSWCDRYAKKLYFNE